MNISPVMTNDYEKQTRFRSPTKQTQSNPISKLIKYIQSPHPLHLKPVKRQLYFNFPICSRYISSKPSEHYNNK